MTGGASASPFSVLGFLWGKTAWNAARTRLARLKEPRYLLGGLVFLAWIGSLLTNRGRSVRFSGRTPRASEVLGLLEPAAAFAIALVVLLWWLLSRGRAALPLSETEVQFLFPAPLPRRALLHFAVLKSYAGVLASAAILTLVMRQSVLPHSWRAFPALFLLMATLQLHHQGLALRRAAWSEALPARRAVLAAASRGGALVFLLALAALAASAFQATAADVSRGAAASLSEMGAALGSALGSSPLGVLVLPFQALVAPLFARDAAGFFRAVPWAALLFFLHHFWVVSAEVRYEDATFENATRRARERAKRHGAAGTARSERSRLSAPFPLRADGRAEIALLWKGLLASFRVPIATLFGATAAGVVALSLAARLAVSRFEAAEPLIAGAAAASAVIGVFLSVLILPLNLRLDFRRDLLAAPAMKLWPLSSTRLAAGEIAAPLVVSTGAAWIGIAIALALSGAVGTTGGLGPWDRIPIALAAAILAPALASVILVVQNGLTLAFPMWFPPSERPSRGFESSGARLVGFFATVVLLGVAAIPSALLAGVAFALGIDLLGLWIAPLAALLAAVPLAAETAAGVVYLGKLFEKFDPSIDLEG